MASLESGQKSSLFSSKFFPAGIDSPFEYTNWRQADRIEVHFRGHKGDKKQRGNVGVRTRDEIGPGYRADGGAVALMVELLSCHPTLPLSSCGREVRVWKYDQALRAFRKTVEKSGRNPKEFALHTLRIGGASTLPSGWRRVSPGCPAER